MEDNGDAIEEVCLKIDTHDENICKKIDDKNFDDKFDLICEKLDDVLYEDNECTVELTVPACTGGETL